MRARVTISVQTTASTTHEMVIGSLVTAGEPWVASSAALVAAYSVARQMTQRAVAVTVVMAIWVLCPIVPPFET
jgi:hypothetical protein